MEPKRLYFVAGEASGDAHGAALMTALLRLRPDTIFSGRGGPKMLAIAGGSFADWNRESAVLGLWEVMKRYGYFREQFTAAIREVGEQNADAVVLIDYPGFNLRLARALREKYPERKLIYYISPQVWAWNRRRIPKMARYLDLMLCIFPFEAELYNKSGLRTIFVGHPMMEALGESRTETERDPNLVGLFPGSRVREVRKILPIMLRTAAHIVAELPHTRFEIAAASSAIEKEINRILGASSESNDTVSVSTNGASATMQRATAGIIASGTATLEAAYFRLPFALVYQVAWLTYLAGRMVVKVKHLGMPNVLAGREIVPEFIQHRAEPRAIADVVLRFMRDKSAREELIAEFDQVIGALGEGGASNAAAEAILQEVA